MSVKINKKRFLCLGAVLSLVLLAACQKTGQESSVSAPEKGPQTGIVPTYQFCHPDKVATFRKKHSGEASSSLGIVRDAKVKVVFDPEALKDGIIKCTVKDCSITTLKPVAIVKTVPLFTGVSLGVQLTIEGRKENGGHPEKKIAGHVELNPFDTAIATVGVFVAGQYSNWRKPNPETEREGRLQLEKKFDCKIGVNCRFPTLVVSLGASLKGLSFDVHGNTATGTPLEYSVVSADYLRSEGFVSYRDIPRATAEGVMGLFRALMTGGGALPRGTFADPEWNELVAQCRAHMGTRENCVRPAAQ